MSMAYAGPVIDPHHHLWDLSLGKHPWLAPRNDGEKAFGSIDAIRTDYGIAEYLRDAKGQNIVATVHVEAGWSDADPLGNNPVFRDGKPVGRATGGNFGFRINKSLALGMVRPEWAHIGTELEMDILGTIHKVKVIPECPYDPENERLRA